MKWVELGSVLVLAVFFRFSARARGEDGFGSALGLAFGAWLGEEVCVRGYGAYRYAPGWSVYLDQVPLVVVLIWPAVILSARAVARALSGSTRPLLVFAVVLFDAALIEPIATHAGLWSWSLPGAFGVPPVGPWGWACYAGAASLCLDAAARSGRRALLSFAAPLAAPLLAHAGILVAWFAFFRWVQVEIPAPAAVAASVCCGVAAALFALRAGRLPLQESIPRVAAATIFAGLLAVHPDGYLLAYAAPFTLPWLILARRTS